MDKQIFEYGTIQYWVQEIDKNQIEKRILMNALVNVMKDPDGEDDFIDILLERLNNCKTTIKWEQEQLEKATKEGF